LQNEFLSQLFFSYLGKKNQKKLQDVLDLKEIYLNLDKFDSIGSLAIKELAEFLGRCTHLSRISIIFR
jgi:hypothetical protein